MKDLVENIVKANTTSQNQTIYNIIKKEELLAYQALVLNVPVSDNVIDFAVNFVHNTRPGESSPNITKKYISWGAGPRASMYLILAANAKALLDGRTEPDISDVKNMIIPILTHRIIPSFNAEADGISRDDILEKLLEFSN